MAKRTNPFIGIDNPAAPTLAQDAANAKFGWFQKYLHGHGKGIAIRQAQDVVDVKKLDLLSAHQNVLAQGSTVSKEATDALEQAGRKFNLARNQLGFEQGKLWPSIKGAVRAMLETVGIDANGIGAGKLRGDVHKQVLKTYESKAGFLERVISKPFRIAVNHPGPALVVTGLGALALGSSYISNRAERRTEREAEEAMMQAQMQAQAMAASRPGQTYKNTVTAEDMMAMQARFAADGKTAPAFAAGVEAQQQEQGQMTSVA